MEISHQNHHSVPLRFPPTDDTREKKIMKIPLMGKKMNSVEKYVQSFDGGDSGARRKMDSSRDSPLHSQMSNHQISIQDRQSFPARLEFMPSS